MTRKKLLVNKLPYLTPKCLDSARPEQTKVKPHQRSFDVYKEQEKL